MNISQLFISVSEKYPDKVAIIEKNKSITFGKLKDDVIATAFYFKSKGILKGDRVLVFVPMGIDLYRIVLALFYIGATAVFIDEWVSMERLQISCTLADCKGLICIFKAKVYSFFLKELRNIPVKLNIGKKINNLLPIEQVEPEATALITYTTGGTGIPKAANRTHDFMQYQFEALIDEIRPNAEDICMSLLPIVTFINLGIGCTSVILNFKISKINQKLMMQIANELNKTLVSILIMSPSYLKHLSEFVLENNYRLENIKKIFTGGAPVFPRDAELFAKAFSNSTIHVIYGSTEAEPISSIEITELINRKNELAIGLPAGKINKNANVKIIKITENSIPPLNENEVDDIILVDGKIGEIIVSGEHVLKQYYKNNDAFKQNKIVVGKTIWHRTNDSGFVKGNELYLTGRCKQLIQRNKKYILPFLIENQLQKIDGIDLGTIIEIENKLYIIVQTKLSSNQVVEHLTYITYDKLIIIPKIPVDERHNSKIDYDKLKMLIKKY